MARDMSSREKAAKKISRLQKQKYDRNRIKKIFPSCIGIFPDPGCLSATAETPSIGDCIKEDGTKKCPYYLELKK